MRPFVSALMWVAVLLHPRSDRKSGRSDVRQIAGRLPRQYDARLHYGEGRSPYRGYYYKILTR
jgi:hypothetical protein